MCGKIYKEFITTTRGVGKCAVESLDRVGELYKNRLKRMERMERLSEEREGRKTNTKKKWMTLKVREYLISKRQMSSHGNGLLCSEKKEWEREGRSGWDHAGWFWDELARGGSEGWKSVISALIRDFHFGFYRFWQDLKGYRVLPLYLIFMFSFLPFLQNPLFVCSLIILIECMLLLASLQTRRSYMRHRMLFLNIFVLAAIDDRMRGVGFLDGIKNICPGFLMDMLGNCNDWLVFFYSAIIYPALFFFAACLPLLCVFWSIALPLVSAAIAGLLGFLIGGVYIGYVCTFLIFLSFVSTFYIFFIFPVLRLEFIRWENCPIESFNEAQAVLSTQQWIGSRYFDFKTLSIGPNHLALDFNVGELVGTRFLRADCNFLFDSVSLIFALVVTFISLLVHFYSIEYMRNDPHNVRFFSFLSLFTFFMMVLVGAGNMVILYIGWEGVGVCSFLLISFWYTRVAAIKAGVKAMIINKIGDMFLLLGTSIILMFSAGSLDIRIATIVAGPAAEEYNYVFGYSFLDLIAVSLCLAAAAKSAQFGFHTWLPDAMEGPTPVSALLHAATMVTAGVFLVVKFSFLIGGSAVAKQMLLFFSVTTMFFGAAVACFQFDIKKIIAYSTSSQLGLMLLAASISAHNLAIFHFFNHAFFKCLLFLLAGIIIHELKNEQDIRKMGNLVEKLPFVFTSFVIASLSLVGFPFFSGATSKDLIFAVTDHLAFLDEGNWGGTFFFLFLRVSSILTIIYSTRLIYYVFFGAPKYRRNLLGRGYYDAGLKNLFYLIPVTVLTIMSVVGGKLFRKFFVHSEGLFIGVENDVFVCDFAKEAMLCKEYSYLSWIISFVGVLIAACTIYYLETYYKEDRGLFFVEHHPRLYALYCFFNKKCYVDDFYAHFIVRPLLLLSFIARKGFERGFFRAGLPVLARFAGLVRFLFSPAGVSSVEFFWLVALPLVSGIGALCAASV